MANSKQVPLRSEVAVEDTWDLSPLFKDDKAFEKTYEEAEKEIPVLENYSGKITESSETLLSYLEERDRQLLRMEFLFGYAFQLSDQDTANTGSQAMKARAFSLYTKLTSAISWEAPQILQMTEEMVEKYCEEKPELENYRHLLMDILSKKEHTLSAEEENLLSLSADMANGPDAIYSMFNDADLVFPEIEDGNGGKVRITQGRFVPLLESKNRQVRKDAFEGLYHTYEAYKNSLSAMFSANVKKELFYTKARKYNSTMEAHLAESHIPTSVYTQLIETVHDFLPSMYRYVSLRKKLLGVEELHMYDVYTPIVSYDSPEYSFEQAKEMVLEGLAPLGEDYLEKLRDGFEHRWIDVYENQGKRSGAYSTCVYGTHPYVLLNYQGTLDNVFTLAHEMGHSLHSCYSNENQTFVNAQYNIFLAEIASTCNEYILISHLLEKTEDKEEKAYLLNHLLDKFKGTIYRQTMFAEFEMIAHEKEANGEPLTSESLCKTYKDLNELYFGPDMVVDDEIAIEWARIPHFYTPFYVYQYATGLSAAIAFGSKILKGEPNALENYKKFLSGGCSVDCLDLLKACGVDMTSKEPTAEALRVFDETLTALEKLYED